jgi:hypothetical protein
MVSSASPTELMLVLVEKLRKAGKPPATTSSSWSYNTLSCSRYCDASSVLFMISLHPN